MNEKQLVSYIAPGAPATRRPARGDEPYLRPEIGFTPRWFNESLGIDFGEQWHIDPAYRKQSLLSMRKELERRFGSLPIGRGNNDEGALDLLTGVFGVSVVASIYGVPTIYRFDNWPVSWHEFLNDAEMEELEPPDLEENPFFRSLMQQMEWIAAEEGQIRGFINWQGVLNNAYRLRGESIFTDLYDSPSRVRHLFHCVTQTMMDGARLLYEYQRTTGVIIEHFTVSNCCVNMISPSQYEEFLLPCDRRFAELFGLIGVHNCAWTVDPYIEAYSSIPNVGYIDMGLDSNLEKVREVFPNARRAIMYKPTDLLKKSFDEIRKDLERIAAECGPCDIVFADIEANTTDHTILEVVRMCEEIGNRYN